uniref:Dynein light chain Tctex-type 1 n=1 Tax=Strix occidentalis caurina TaxID=311401 RepID=A0A8D0F2G9_STROC
MNFLSRKFPEEFFFLHPEFLSYSTLAIESAIGGNAYQHSKVNQWTTSVVEQTLSQLTKLGKPFKYIVTCVIMQKNGAGLHTASSCFWDNSSDGTCTVRWENKTMYCIVSAFGLAI